MKPNAEICSRFDCPYLHRLQRGRRRLRRCDLTMRYPGSMNHCPGERF